MLSSTASWETCTCHSGGRQHLVMTRSFSEIAANALFIFPSHAIGTLDSIFARAGLRGALGFAFAALLDEFHQAVNQAATAADHVKAAFVLVLLENVVDLVLQFRHGTPPLWTVSTLTRAGAG